MSGLNVLEAVVGNFGCWVAWCFFKREVSWEWGARI
jgi:hypothetical protein